MNMSKSLAVFGVVACFGFGACPSDDEGSGDVTTDATSGGDADATGTSETDSSETETDLGDTTTSTNGDTTGTTDTTPDVDDNIPTLVRIVSPSDGSKLSGSVLVRAEPVGREELLVDNVIIRVNGTTVRQDVKLPTEFVLDTKQYGTLGALTIEATATAGFDSGKHRVETTIDNPPIVYREVTPQERFVRDGQLVSFIVKMEGPPSLDVVADFSVIDSNYDPLFSYSQPLGANQYSISYFISATNTKPDGEYTIPITASTEVWSVDYNQAKVTLRNRTTSSVSVPSGLFVDALLPQPSNTPTGVIPKPVVESTTTNVVTGGSVPLNIDYSAYEKKDEIIGIIVGLEGQAGYYQIPISGPEDLTDPEGILEFTMLLRAFASFESAPTILPVRVALRDALGRVSAYGSYIFDVVAVGSGDIQVSVSWDSPTDVDLHVVDPFGEEIYYGNRTSSSGGELDLDSNAGCGIDGVNNENVYWPDQGAPIGNYTVRVAYWSDCASSSGSCGSTGCDANYTVTVNYCGKTEIFEGYFAAGTDTGGGAGTGVHITEVNNSVCQTSVRGRVRYEDRTFDRTGFGASAMKPVRNALVEVRRLQGGEVVGTGVTDDNGDYNVGFTNDGPPGLTVVVKAQTDASLGLRDIKVLDHPKFKNLYTVASPPLVFTPGQEVIVRDVDITVELDAGAFNVFDTLLSGYDLVRRATGKDLGELTGFWATGADTTDTIYCSQFLYDNGVCTELFSVSVQGKSTDRDEYDDMVILKEFFKFALNAVSLDNHPGGKPAGVRTDRNMAWTEGVSTFFADDVLATRWFVNSRPLGVYLVEDLEMTPTPFAYKTSDETMAGDLAPELVAGLLWDLADGADNEVYDNVEGGQTAIYDVLFNYFPSDRYVDRGAEGIDIVDFLDGWFCRGWGQRTDVEAILDDRAFPYDFGGPTGCDMPDTIAP